MQLLQCVAQAVKSQAAELAKWRRGIVAERWVATAAVCLEKCEIEEENSLFNEKKIGNLNLGTARSDQKEITDA